MPSATPSPGSTRASGKRRGRDLARRPTRYPYGLAWDEAARPALREPLEQGRGRRRRHRQGRGRRPLDDRRSIPTRCSWPRGGKILYVANANRNTVSVFDTEAGKAVETIGTAIDPNAPPGSTPSSLALTPDESILFVANANTNDLAVVNVKEPGESTPLGFIPAGWYPTSVRVARDGKTLYVANGKGATSKANRDGPNPLAAGARTRPASTSAACSRGRSRSIPMPGPKQMAAYSQTVYECSPLQQGDPTGRHRPDARGRATRSPPRSATRRRSSTASTSSRRTGPTTRSSATCPKATASRTSACSPRRSRPTIMPWSREFVLLDNFYVESEVSADGHEWTMGAYATDFVERTWPLGYRGDRRVPYPSEGALAIARPAGGYLWDRAAEKGVSYRSYGEFIENGTTPDDPGDHQRQGPRRATSTRCSAASTWTTPTPKRADRFLEELAGFEKAGEMPRLIILRLPNDHTSGHHARQADRRRRCVADNDLALGRVVEGLSKSRFWKKMAIFVVEDDAQNGSDHVDAHRTVALAISPYIKRHSVDSTMYSTSSMLRTMELILGLEPMSQFDAAARPMSDVVHGHSPTSTPVRPSPGPASTSNAKNTRDAPGGRGLEAARPRDRGPRRRPRLQRDHLEGRQGRRTRRCRRRSARRS